MNHIYKLLWCFMLSMKSFRFEVRDNLIVCDGISSNLNLFTPSSRFIFCAKHPRALISPFRVWVVMEALNCGYKERQMFAVKTPSQILQPSIRSLIFQSQFAGKKQQQEEIKKKAFRSIYLIPISLLANSHPFSIFDGCVNTDISRGNAT